MGCVLFACACVVFLSINSTVSNPRSDSMSSSSNAVNSTRNSSVSGVGGMRAVGAANGSSANKPLQVLVRKRPTGRIRKWMGDLSLQV